MAFCGILPTTGMSVTARRSDSERIRLFIASRNTAIANPIASPIIVARTRISRLFGEIGTVGTVAGWTTVTRTTGSSSEPSTVSSSVATVWNRLAAALATAAACSGSVSVTRICSNTVSTGAVAETRSARERALSSRPSSSTTGSSTTALSTIRAYVFTRSSKNADPCTNSAVLGPDPGATNSSAVAS